MATVGPRQGKPPFGLENPPERGGRTLGATKKRTAWPREQGYWHGGLLSGHQKSPGQPRGLRRATPTATATSPQLVLVDVLHLVVILLIVIIMMLLSLMSSQK